MNRKFKVVEKHVLPLTRDVKVEIEPEDTIFVEEGKTTIISGSNRNHRSRSSFASHRKRRGFAEENREERYARRKTKRESSVRHRVLNKIRENRRK